MTNISVNDLRLTRSIALLGNPFERGDVLEFGGGRLELNDKVFPLAKISQNAFGGWVVRVDDGIPVAAFNNKLRDAISAVTGQDVPVMSPAETNQSIKFASAAPFAPIGCDAALSINATHLAVLRRDLAIPEASMPGHIAVPGGFFEGDKKLGNVAKRELAEETMLAKVEALDGKGGGTVTCFDFTIAGAALVGYPHDVREQRLRAALAKWHGLTGDVTIRHEPLALTPSPLFAGEEKLVLIKGDRQIESLRAKIGWQMWRGIKDGELFEGPMNVLGIVEAYDVHIDGQFPAVTPLDGTPTAPRVGDILVLDGDPFGRAGGARRPQDFAVNDKYLPTVRGLLRELRPGEGF